MIKRLTFAGFAAAVMLLSGACVLDDNDVCPADTCVPMSLRLVDHSGGDLSILRSFYDWMDDLNISGIIQDSISINLGKTVDSFTVGFPITVAGSDSTHFPIVGGGDILIMVTTRYTGHGSYNIQINPDFAAELNSLDRRFVYSLVRDEFGNTFAVSDRGDVHLIFRVLPPFQFEEWMVDSFVNQLGEIDFSNYADVLQGRVISNIP